MEEFRTCARCGKTKSIDEYGKRGNDKSKICKECVNTDAKKRIKLTTDYVKSKKTECCICGYNACNAALEFHHLDGDDKSITLGVFSTSRFFSPAVKKIIDDELAKCIVVCANCHREIHNL